jgi:ferric-dicitrate binding protein FerR (iron transport regulator)
VETQDLKITVLGTSFNVRSLENESTACVTVATGKVFVTTHKGNEKIFLTPNKQLILNKITGKYKVNELKVLSDLDWKEDIMRANKTPIEEFVKKIESYYNIEVRLQGTKIKDITLSGVHQNKSLWSVLESLKYATGISYKQEGKTIILYK